MELVVIPESEPTHLLAPFGHAVAIVLALAPVFDEAVHRHARVRVQQALAGLAVLVELAVFPGLPRFIGREATTWLDCGSGVVRYEKCLICNRLLVWNVPAMIFLF